MRVRLPALIALASATTYAACSSSDATKAVQEGGAGGEAGEVSNSGGSNTAAGSKNGGGSLNVAGQGADAGMGGVPVTGQGGAAAAAGAGAGSMLGGAAGAEMAAAGAGGETPVDTSLPAACPGVVGDYTLKVGTEGADQYPTVELADKNLIFGLEGDDVFGYDGAGEDCLIGGPGDDEFTSPGEFASHFFGGPGADLFHIQHTYSYLIVEDMASDDTIGLAQSAFTFLFGQPGATPDAAQLVSLPGYAQGNASLPVSEFSGAIVYDPNDGSLWQDLDRGDKSTGATQIGTIANHSTYTFNADDFVIE